MPNLDLSQNILSAEASFKANDWASAEARVSSDFRAGAKLTRGVDLELGVSVMGELNAIFNKYISIEAEATAQASARLKGQIQAPLDLFTESGMAIRLQAVAEAAVFIKASIGLSIGDFIELAKQDPKIDGVYLKLLIIFLEEININAGVFFKAAFSAMAFVNIGISGRLVKDEINNLPPGFTIGFDYGVGLEGGYGMGMFANLGLKDTRRFVKRSIDVLVDEAINEIEPHLDDLTARQIASELRTPTKIAFRCAFEIGYVLANYPASLTDPGPKLAQTCLQVAIEEFQRYYLEKLISFGMESFQNALAQIGVDEATWDSSEAIRNELVTILKQIPSEPFDLNTANISYWESVITKSIDLALTLGGTENLDEEWIEPMAIIWSAHQLIRVNLHNILNVTARASFFGLSVDVTAAPFSGDLMDNTTPPPVIKKFINKALNRSQNKKIQQEDLVTFLIRDSIINNLVEAYPELEQVFDIIAGENGNGIIAAVTVIMNNSNSFVDKNGKPDAEATLSVFADGMRAYIITRVNGELRPYINEQFSDQPELLLYINEVILDTFDFIVKQVFTKVLSWSVGNLDYKTALKEGCSSVLMKLFGRSLVVTADILINKGLEESSEQLVILADHIDDKDGIADVLSNLTGVEKDFLSEVMVDTTIIASEVFSPLPDSTRSKIRHLLYSILDTVPSPPPENWIDQLATDLFMPNSDVFNSITELSEELGGIVMESLQKFFQKVLLKIAEKVYDEFLEYLEDVEEFIHDKIEEIEELLNDILDRLSQLPGEVLQLLENANLALDEALESLLVLSAQINSSAAINSYIDSIESNIVSKAKGALSNNDVYKVLPAQYRSVIETHLENIIKGVSGLGRSFVINPITSQLSNINELMTGLIPELQEVLRALRDINPNINITDQVKELLLLKIKEIINTAFGTTNIKIPIEFTASYRPPSILGYQPPDLTWKIDLGEVSINTNQIINLVMDSIESLSAFENLARIIGEKIISYLDNLQDAQALEGEKILLETSKNKHITSINAAYLSNFEIEINQPLHGSEHMDSTKIQIMLKNIPKSYLGLENEEIQKVFVQLNGKDLALGRFDIEGEGIEISDEVNSLPYFPIVTLTGFLASDTPMVEKVAKGNQVKSKVAHNTTTVSKQRYISINEKNPTKNMAKLKSRGTGIKGKQISNLTPKDKKMPKENENLGIVLISQVENIMYASNQYLSPNDIGLSYQVPSNKLKEGINTLAVAIITGKGNKKEEVVSFIFKKLKKVKKTKTGKVPKFSKVADNMHLFESKKKRERNKKSNLKKYAREINGLNLKKV